MQFQIDIKEKSFNMIIIPQKQNLYTYASVLNVNQTFSVFNNFGAIVRKDLPIHNLIVIIAFVVEPSLNLQKAVVKNGV